MRLRELTDVSAAVAATRSRKAKTEAIAALLAGAAPDEVAAAVAFLSGRLTQRQIGVGWAQLREPPPPAAEPSLTVAEVDAAFGAIGAIGGAGSQAARRAALAALLERADADEQRFLTRLLLGDLGQGALAGVMAAAIARAAEVPEADVRRALTLSGDLAETAAIALADGSEGLAKVRLQVGRAALPHARRHRARRRRRAREDRPGRGRVQARRRPRADPPRRRRRRPSSRARSTT